MNQVPFIAVDGGRSTVHCCCRWPECLYCCCCRGQSQQLGDVCPGASGVTDMAMTNFLPTVTATAMNMLVGLLRYV